MTTSAIPNTLEFDEILGWLLGLDQPTAEEIEQAGARVGRNAYPALVADLLRESRLSPEAAQIVVSSAWNASEFPRMALDEATWRTLFDLGGYVVDGIPVERPPEPLTLWRGALPGHELGWSWTDDRELASWFADRPHHRGRGVLVTADVDPARLLARITDRRPGESEYVVDARDLERWTNGTGRR